MTENTWIMIGTLGTALATFLLAAFAYYAWQAAKSTATAANETLEHARRDSHARTRPYVAATLQPSISGVANYDMVLMNFGNSSAQDIQIRCIDGPDTPDDIARMVLEWLSMTHTLHPGMRLRNYWRLELQSGHTWADNTTEPAGMPAVAHLEITYRDAEGNVYNDRFELNTRVYKGAPVPESGPNVKSNLSDDQKDLHKMLAVVARALGELRR